MRFRRELFYVCDFIFSAHYLLVYNFQSLFVINKNVFELKVFVIYILVISLKKRVVFDIDLLDKRRVLIILV